MNGKIVFLLIALISSAFGRFVIEIEPKVVNGTDADIAEFPFMISLRRNGGHNCGATILNEWWLLTAAHCLGGPVETYTAQYANTVISRDGSNVVKVAEIIQHEDYSPANQYINDIGLVKLAEPISNDLNDFKVRMPLYGTYYETGTPAVLSGWGLNATNGTVQQTLQKVNLQIYSAFDCNLIHRARVHFTNICGGIPEGQKGQCSGDSGGPLLVDGVQVGIVSWSVKPCAVAPYPGVYTGVTHYVKWIEEQTGINFKLNMYLRARSTS